MTTIAPITRYAGAALLLLVLLFTLPPTEARAQRTQIVDNEKDGTTRYYWSERGRTLEVKLRGEVEFNGELNGIASLSPDGYLFVEDERGRERRRLEVRPNSGGTLRYAYFEQGREQAFGVEAKDWLANLLPEIVGRTGIGAERRVQYLLSREGVDGVFEEIDGLEGSSARRAYATALLAYGKLDRRQLERFMREVVTETASSGDKAQLLIDATPYYLAASGDLEAYLQAADTIPSSGDKTRVLMHVLQEYDVARDDLVRLLEAARGIPSSGDRARLLLETAPRYVGRDAGLRDVYFEALNGIPSSGDRTRVLLHLFENGDVKDKETLLEMFRVAGDIPSSGDRARLLTTIAPRYVNDAEMRQLFFGAVDTIPSSGDRTRVLLDLVQEARLDRASMASVLASARGIASGGDKTRLLVRVAPLVATDDDLVERYLEAAETIGSSGDRSRALAALLDAGRSR